MNIILDLTKTNVGTELDRIITKDLISTDKKEMKVSKRYYDKKS